MTRYHLHISADGLEDADDAGHDFTDLRLAVAAAGKTAGELLHDALRDGTRDVTVRVRVCDGDNEERAVVTAKCELR